VSVIVQNAAAIFSNAAMQRLINWKRLQARTAMKTNPTTIFMAPNSTTTFRTHEVIWDHDHNP